MGRLAIAREVMWLTGLKIGCNTLIVFATYQVSWMGTVHDRDYLSDFVQIAVVLAPYGFKG